MAGRRPQLQRRQPLATPEDATPTQVEKERRSPLHRQAIPNDEHTVTGERPRGLTRSHIQR